ncbi:MAG: DUF512 domain-containing protein [Thermodesulfovibrionaceae bacterium]
MSKGLKIEKVLPNTLASSVGMKAGDIILSINGHPIKDPIDLMFYSSEEKLNILIKRDSQILSFSISRIFEPIGIEVEQMRVKRCKNKCLFCFVDQLPKGLRKSLYVKDEDYRASFLYGNYITLTNLTKKDYERIKKMRLSPLYVSVHATDPEIRNTLIGNFEAPPIMTELKKLAKYKIRIHAQIVVCPGINDGEVLEKTIKDLSKLYPYVASVAVVPVGLTKYHKNGLTAVDKKKAREVIEIVSVFQKRFHKKFGITFAYLADEFYIKADVAFPSLKTYDDFPQIENGVGMVVSFLDKAMKLSIPTVVSKRRFVTFTGTSFFPFLREFIEKLKKKNIPIDVYPIKNNLFGETVTVTGLLTGQDICKELSPYIESNDVLLVPDVTMKDSENKFLDDFTLADIEKILGVKTFKVGANPEDLLKVIQLQN